MEQSSNERRPRGRRMRAPAAVILVIAVFAAALVVLSVFYTAISYGFGRSLLSGVRSKKAAAAVETLAQELDGAFDEIYYSDLQDYSYSWYYLYAHLYDDAYDDRGYVAFDFSQDGELEELSYYIFVDVSAEMEQTLDNIRETMTEMNERLLDTTLSQEYPEIFAVNAFDEFFLTEIAYRGYYYTDTWYMEDFGENEEYHMYQSFYTEEREDFDRYTDPYVVLNIYR